MTSGDPIVSVVILNWNGAGVIKECIDSVLDQSLRDFEIIVVDNGSDDGSPEMIAEIYPESVLLIRNEKNEGFSKGCNIGISKARGKYIALLNNDAVAGTEWLACLSGCLSASPGTGMAASKILNYDNTDKIDNIGHLLYPDGINRGRGRGEKDNGQYDREGECLFPSGCAGMYKKEMLEEIGLFDEEFFAYGDDTDIGLRGRLCGWEAVFCPGAAVYHRYSFTSGAYSAEKFFLVERNRMLILLKYFPPLFIMLSPIYTLNRYFHHLVAALIGKGSTGGFSGNVFDLFLIMLKAHCSAFKLLPTMLKNRLLYRKVLGMDPARLYPLIKKFPVSAKELAYKD